MRQGRRPPDAGVAPAPWTLAVAALNQTPLDWGGNLARIVESVERAKALGAHLLILPELAISGYGCEDAFLSQAVHREAWGILDALRQRMAGGLGGSSLTLVVGLPLWTPWGRLNGAAVLGPGGILRGLVAKHALANDGVHYEPRWFVPWVRGRVEPWDLGAAGLGDGRVDLGDQVFAIQPCGLRLGIEICEDAWVEDRPAELLVSKLGATLLANLSASHFAFGKLERRQAIVASSSKRFACPYAYANLCGNEAGRVIYDGGSMVAVEGQVVAMTARLSFADAQVVAVGLAGSRLASGVLAGQGSSRSQVAGRSDWESSEVLKHQEFARAVALGLFDYLRKSRMAGFVVSLSGGADSAACAVLVAMMVRLGLRELGHASFLRRLGHEPHARDPQELMREILHCVYMGTAQSSETTRRAAEGLALALSAEWSDLDVDPIVDAYRQHGAAVMRRPLTWTQDDVALQNVQARARGPLVWLIANLRGALLLTTSNRSEAAVGYATMDGDTCGGLAPLAGIDKAYLRRWLAWVETEGLEELGPVAALNAVNVQAPTAELRPAAMHQTDEVDLMPYDILDRIERLAIRDREPPARIWQILCAEEDSMTRARDAASADGGDATHVLARWVERFFVLWSRNQWKRERYAPGFHLDDENLDPKTWCRFPILSGGYRRELEALWERVARRAV